MKKAKEGFHSIFERVIFINSFYKNNRNYYPKCFQKNITLIKTYTVILIIPTMYNFAEEYHDEICIHVFLETIRKI